MLEVGRSVDGTVDHEKHYVVVKYTGCGMVSLDYKCWIDSELYLRVEPVVRQAIFLAFRDNGITDATIVQAINLHTT